MPGIESLDLLLIAAVLFLAVFTQTVTGFGMGLVAMPLLTLITDLDKARPLVSMTVLVTGVTLVLRYRRALTFAAVRGLIGAAVVGVPIGFLVLEALPRDWVTHGLGALVIVYAVYALFSPRVPEFRARAWGVGFGFLGGLFSGAYNTGGPPVVIWCSGRDWSPQTFKGNLQSYSLVMGVMVFSGHIASGNVTQPVLISFAAALPAILIAIGLGFALDGRMNALTFRRVVLVLLLLAGIRLLM
jgi:uncharacterized membrane protein YfcA